MAIVVFKCMHLSQILVLIIQVPPFLLRMQSASISGKRHVLAYFKQATLPINIAGMQDFKEGEAAF